MIKNLPQSLTTVTPFSKYLAMALFIILPFAGFYVGTQYQQAVNQTQESEIVNSSYPTPTPTDEASSWKTYSSNQYKYSVKYPTSVNFSTSTYQGAGGTVNKDIWTSQDSSYKISVYSYKSNVGSRLEFNLEYQPKELIQINNQNVNKVASVDETLIHVGPISNADHKYMIIYASGIKRSNEGLSLFDQILSTFKFTN